VRTPAGPRDATCHGRLDSFKQSPIQEPGGPVSKGADRLQALKQKADIGVGLKASSFTGPQRGFRMSDHQLPCPLVPFEPGPVKLCYLPGRKT